MRVWLSDESATLRAGALLADALEAPGECPRARVEALRSGLHLHLLGGLGAGKTTLVRGLLRAMGVGGAVKSPTYTLVEPYQTACWEVFHFDLYRLGSAGELDLLGVRDYFHCRALCIFEWPSKGGAELPPPSLQLSLEVVNGGRELHTVACDEPGRLLERALKKRLKS